MPQLSTPHRHQPTWTGSRAQQLLDRILRAACERIPGYGDAPWYWTRQAHPTGTPIGLCRSWRPPVDVDWFDPSGPPDAWEDAALVVITLEAIPDLPAALPSRRDVYLCAPARDLEDSWPAVARCGAEVIVTAPAGLDWLSARVAEARQEDRPLIPAP